MSSRVAKWVFVLMVGGALSALGAAPQPGPSPHIVLEQPPWEQLPKIEPFITGLADIEAVLLNAAGTKGYIVHVDRADNAFITEFTVPNTKGGTCELGVLKGPRGSHAAAYDEANARLWVGNFPENSISVVDVSKPLEKKCVVVATIPLPGPPTDVKIYKDGRVFVSVLTNAVIVLDITGIKATIDLSEVCLGPSAIAFGDGSLYVACQFTNNVVWVDIASQLGKVVYATNWHPWQKPIEGPVDLVVNRGKIHVAASVSDTAEVLEVKTLWKLAEVSLSPGQQTVAPNPRYIAISPEGRFVYVSNAADQSVSVICWYTNKRLTTFRAIAPSRITPPGVIAAVDHQGKHLLYVADKGGILQIFVMDWAYSQYATECP
jgi:DNA-binding beta-propeller fold protein YncE